MSPALHLTRCGETPDSLYLECVALLRSRLISNPPYVRPSAPRSLAPFDQASQKPSFGPNVDRGSPEEFLAWATAQRHPAFAPRSRLDDDLEAAIQYVWSHGSAVAQDREERLSLLRHVSMLLHPLSLCLASRACDTARSVARAMRLNIVRRTSPSASLDDLAHDDFHFPHFGLWCAFLDAIDWPHTSLVHNMLHGYPSVGEIPDTGVFRTIERPAAVSGYDFRQSNAAWSRQCRARVLSAARADPARALACWEKTLDELDSGLISGPFTLSDIEGRGPHGYGFGKFRPLPRFAIWQGKWRCIDDALAAGSNQDGTSTHETIVCDTADSPMRIGIVFHELGPPPSEPELEVEMGGSGDDAFAAYRRICTADEAYTIFMVAAPPDALSPGSELQVLLFKVPGHNFGLVSAVLNWNATAEAPLRFSRRFFGTCATRFYDDHQVTEPRYAASSGQSCHFELHELLHFHFDYGKHTLWSPVHKYIGVETDWSRERDGIVSIGAGRDRRNKIRDMIRRAFASDCLTPAEASTLRGKSRYCVSPVFGRVGVAAVHLLRERQYSRSKEHGLTDELRDILRLLDAVVDQLPSFTVHFRQDRIRPMCVVLTDASFATGHTWLGFLIMCPIRGGLWAGAATPAWLLRVLQTHKQRDTYIGQLESAVVSSPLLSVLDRFPDILSDRPVMHYIDNQGSLYSVINGRSSDDDTNRLVFVSRLFYARARCDVWYDYVPSASNIADLPTRLDAAAFTRLEKVARRVPFRLIPEWCMSCPYARLASLF